MNSEERAMKRYVIVLLLLVGTGLVVRRSDVGAQSAPQEIPFDSVANFFKLPPGMLLR